MEVAEYVLGALRLIVFALALGLTIVSFQAYRRRPTPRLEAAFTGFAFLSMGVALTTIRPGNGELRTAFEMAETVPFIIGFGALYASLYR